MYPDLNIGPVTLHTFGLMFALAFLAAGATVGRRLRELGKPTDWAYEMVFAALVGGLVGSRLDFLIENWSDVSHDVLKNVFSGSGLVWFGGAPRHPQVHLLGQREHVRYAVGVPDRLVTPALELQRTADLQRIHR